MVEYHATRLDSEKISRHAAFAAGVSHLRRDAPLCVSTRAVDNG